MILTFFLLFKKWQIIFNLYFFTGKQSLSWAGRIIEGQTYWEEKVKVTVKIVLGKLSVKMCSSGVLRSSTWKGFEKCFLTHKIPRM